MPKDAQNRPEPSKAHIAAAVSVKDGKTYWLFTIKYAATHTAHMHNTAKADMTAFLVFCFIFSFN